MTIIAGLRPDRRAATWIKSRLEPRPNQVQRLESEFAAHPPEKCVEAATFHFKGAHQQGIEKAIAPEVYVPVEQAPYPLAMLFVRASLPKAELARAIRQAVAAVNKNVPVHNIISMEELLSDSVSERRFTMALLGGFSALALKLAMMGVYGVVSYMVSQRTPEIGIRIALGAQGRDVLRLVLAQGLKPVVIGSVIGLMGSLTLTRALSSLLYGVTATDPATFAIVALLLSIAAMRLIENSIICR
jgi:putative ABC transport system permease protein